MSIVVRPANLEDLYSLSMLFMKYLQHHNQTRSAADCILFVEKRLKLNDSILYVVENPADKKVVGFTQLNPEINSFSLKKVWNLSDVFIDVPYRRLGFGRLLLKECEKFSQTSGADGLTLKINHEDQVAQSLYQAMGWKRENENTYILNQNMKNEYTVMLPF